MVTGVETALQRSVDNRHNPDISYIRVQMDGLVQKGFGKGRSLDAGMKVPGGSA